MGKEMHLGDVPEWKGLRHEPDRPPEPGPEDAYFGITPKVAPEPEVETSVEAPNLAPVAPPADPDASVDRPSGPPPSPPEHSLVDDIGPDEDMRPLPESPLPTLPPPKYDGAEALELERQAAAEDAARAADPNWHPELGYIDDEWRRQHGGDDDEPDPAAAPAGPPTPEGVPTPERPVVGAGGPGAVMAPRVMGGLAVRVAMMSAIVVALVFGGTTLLGGAAGPSVSPVASAAPGASTATQSAPAGGSPSTAPTASTAAYTAKLISQSYSGSTCKPGVWTATVRIDGTVPGDTVEFTFAGPGLPASQTFTVGAGGVVTFSMPLPGTGMNVATLASIDGNAAPASAQLGFGGNYCPGGG